MSNSFFRSLESAIKVIFIDSAIRVVLWVLFVFFAICTVLVLVSLKIYDRVRYHLVIIFEICFLLALFFLAIGLVDIVL